MHGQRLILTNLNLLIVIQGTLSENVGDEKARERVNVPSYTVFKWHKEHEEKVTNWHKEADEFDFEEYLRQNPSVAKQFSGLPSSCQVFGGSSLSGNQFQNCTINIVCNEKKDMNNNKENVGY